MIEFAEIASLIEAGSGEQGAGSSQGRKKKTIYVTGYSLLVGNLIPES
jgi:hypothetical protein